MERDSLKNELQESKMRAVALQQQLGEIQAKLTAAAAALVPPAGDQKEPAKGEKKAGDGAKPATGKTGKVLAH